jgi:hypothetical protein
MPLVLLDEAAHTLTVDEASGTVAVVLDHGQCT